MTDSAPTTAAAWTPLTPTERRVAGVLVEKAKTTPDVYPLSLNAIRVGCNQKNNRDPLTQYEDDDVQRALDALREKRAVMEVQGGARVPKYRHLLYEWLGVDKIEISVMAELLLRGPQTEGELRARASRMDPIADLTALRAVLERLKARGLVISLTSEGRGHVVTHGLYRPPELQRLREEYAAGGPRATPAETHDDSDNQARESDSLRAESTAAPRSAATQPAGDLADLALAQRRIVELESQLSELRDQMEDKCARIEDRLARLEDFRARLEG